jgi:hypothetical protein
MEKQHIGTFSFSREWQRIETRTERAKNIAKSDKVGQPDIAV